MTDKVRPQCGTSNGCKIHRQNDEPICDTCRVEHSERAKEYRSRPEVQEHRRALNRAERRTLARLKKEFPEKYEEFFEEEKFRSLIEEFGSQGSINEE